SSRATSDIRGSARSGNRSEGGAEPDADIQALVAAGDFTASLRLLMKRHGPPVYRPCRGAPRDAALADDIHQQVFIEAHRDLGRFAGRSTIRTWLFAIARHRVLDAAKARSRRGAHVDREADLGGLPDAAPAADERIDDARLRAAL